MHIGLREWNPEPLFNTFLQGLSEEIKDKLAAQELPLELDSLIALTIRIDGDLRERRRERSGLGNIRPSAAVCSPPKESGNPRSVHFCEKLKPPEFPQESLATGESDTPEPLQLGRARLPS